MIRGFAIAAVLSIAAPAWAAAPCPNPWMPLVRGATWTYRAANGERITLRVSDADAKPGFVIATMDTMAPLAAGETAESGLDPVLQTTFLCTADGMSLPFGEAVNAGRLHIETLREEGVTLPSPEKLIPGAQWSSARTLRISSGDRVARTRIASAHQAAALEKIETPAGTFEAMRIDVALDISSVVDAPRPAPSASGLLPTKGVAHLWFAKGVGLVKMTSDVPPIPGANTPVPAPSLELMQSSGTKR